jgi:enoyl-CoA hydratase/carnithine racemase
MIHWTVADGVATCVLDQPDRRNAIDTATVAELTRLLTTTGEPAPPIVLTGAGSTFCSGFDLNTRSEGLAFKAQADGLFSTILSYPAPVVAALNGPAVGMGCVLAATCDVRIGCEQSWLEVPAARLGVVLDEVYIGRIRDRLGMATAQLLVIASQRVEAADAARLGAIHDLVDDPLATATALAAHAAALSAASLAAHKSFVNHGR